MAVYKGDYSGIGQMLRSPFIKAELTARAERVKAAAQASAPVGNPAEDDHSGTFAASFRIVHSTQASRHGPGSRAIVSVVSTDPLGLIKEVGGSRRVINSHSDDAMGIGEHAAMSDVGAQYKHIDGHHTLLRALDAAR